VRFSASKSLYVGNSARWLTVGLGSLSNHAIHDDLGDSGDLGDRCRRVGLNCVVRL